MQTKAKSFTLSELLVVMIITAIIVGMAFSVLRQVQKQIHIIQENYEKNNSLALFEQKLCQDFNECSEVSINGQKTNMVILSETDTVTYIFDGKYVLRNNDTLKLKLVPEKIFLQGTEVKEGSLDAVSISTAELPDYHIFVSRKNDAAFFMNQDGF